MRDFTNVVGTLVRFRVVLAISAILVCFSTGGAQTLRARITVLSSSPARLKIEGESPTGAERWSFINTYGSVIGLGDRIHKLALKDSVGHEVAVRTVALGEFQGAQPATRFSYEVDAAPPRNPEDAAHVSWLYADSGCLMLADLLPHLASSHDALVDFSLPSEWTISSSVMPDVDRQYRLREPEKSVFFVGRGLREKHRRVGSTDFVFAMSGSWVFSDDDAMKIAARVLKEDTESVRHSLDGRAMLMLASLPGSYSPERWSAEARGSSVVLLFGRGSARGPTLGRLGIALTHELFHLWVPGSLPFDGDYDWFFEGFTLYQALRSAVRLGFIDFSEYLTTMGRVYDSYLATLGRDRFSLIEASQRRWTSATSLVYDKGMLVAFLCDLVLRSGGRKYGSLDDVYRALFFRYATGARVDGNEAVATILTEALGSAELVERYIKGPGEIELERLLAPYGLRVGIDGARKHLSVFPALTRPQRELLRSLGYSHGK